jgi:hypothetical protein
LKVTTMRRPFRFSASSTARHWASSVTIGFSVTTSMPRSSALTMQSACVASTVVTMRASGLVLVKASSSRVKVGQEIPSARLAASARSGLTSQSPTNSTMSA